MKAALPISKTTLSSRGQLVIPVEVREALGLHSGSELTIVTREDGVIELRPRKRRIEDLFSHFAAPPPALTKEVLTDDEALLSAILEEDTRTRRGQTE